MIQVQDEWSHKGRKALDKIRRTDPLASSPHHLEKEYRLDIFREILNFFETFRP